MGFMASKLPLIRSALSNNEVKYEKGAKMSVQLQIEEMPGYLAARFTGTGTPEEAWRQFELIAEHCKRTNKNKLLLDYAEAHGEVSLADRYFLGEEAQIFARYGLKVASVATQEQIDPRRFGEMVAQNRGVNVRGFTNVKDAEKWLLN
jgi:hypothetical protein